MSVLLKMTEEYKIIPILVCLSASYLATLIDVFGVIKLNTFPMPQNQSRPQNVCLPVIPPSNSGFLLATAVDTHLGAENFDDRVVDYFTLSNSRQKT
jgi:hypothetical protein